MIVISVRLVSAIHPSRSKELARMEIANDLHGSVATGGSHGDYDCRTLRGRSTDQLDKRVTQRDGRVLGFNRTSTHVWCLVARALNAMGYK